MIEESAREVASHWHGGMSSALYAFSSTGTIRDDLLSEIEDAIESCSVTEQEEGDIDRLTSLLHYVKTESRPVVTLMLPATVHVMVNVEDGRVERVHILPSQSRSDWRVWGHTKACSDADDARALEIADTTCWDPVLLGIDENEGFVWEA